MVCKIRCAKFRVEHFLLLVCYPTNPLLVQFFPSEDMLLPSIAIKYRAISCKCSLLKALSASQQGNFDTENFFGGMILCNPSLSFMGGTVTKTPCT